jgi:hypothetical protein
VSGTLFIAGGFSFDALVIPVCMAKRGFAWGREGHEVVALIAEHYMAGAARAKSTALLDGSSIEAVASWADDYRSPKK